MRVAYVCAPLAGDLKKNISNAKKFGKFLFDRGMAPVIPHIYAEILDDKDPYDRELGMNADRSLLFKCDEMWVFGDKFTKGMKEEIHFAKMINMKIKYISDSEVDKYEC
jgi:hypothetical protein